jgi:CpeT protein
LLSWDRGWDVNGKQVWGAEKGGYIFVKTTE